MHEVAIATGVQEDWFRRKKGIIGLDEVSSKYRVSEYYIDKNFFKVFSYDLKAGDQVNPLKNDESILISDELADMLFKHNNPVGELISWEQEGTSGVYMVTGVFEKPKANSTHQFDVLLSLDVRSKRDSLFGNWFNSKVNTYVVLNENADLKSFERNLSGVMNRKQEGNDITLLSQNYKEKYLNDAMGDTINEAGGRGLMVKLFGTIALFVLMIASINFMNLTTARASRRLKEIGVKKAIGATRKALMGQYFAESMLLSFMSLFLAILLAVMFMPSFEKIISKDLSFPLDIGSLGIFFSMALMMGFISGVYPALYLSKFRPIEVLKGKIDST
ncbi:MAG: FtsX-like permease family protein, partial [Bacteroidota bacterium]